MLKEKLKKHLELKIPIISMVAVIGSTEESAVDPIYEIFEMREEFKKQVRLARLIFKYFFVKHFQCNFTA